jgi:hypothetical protein
VPDFDAGWTVTDLKDGTPWTAQVPGTSARSARELRQWDVVRTKDKAPAAAKDRDLHLVLTQWRTIKGHKKLYLIVATSEPTLFALQPCVRSPCWHHVITWCGQRLEKQNGQTSALTDKQKQELLRAAATAAANPHYFEKVSRHPRGIAFTAFIAEPRQGWPGHSLSLCAERRQ